MAILLCSANPTVFSFTEIYFVKLYLDVDIIFNLGILPTACIPCTFSHDDHRIIAPCLLKEWVIVACLQNTFKIKVI